MNRITTRLKRYGCLLLCLCLLMPLLQGTAAAVQDSSVVRVAWYPDFAYNITCENGERSGYGYEYQQSVAAYTGWTYHYIEANWSDSLNMLQKGEIDLMAYAKQGTQIEMQVEAQTDGVISVPLFGYDGYRAQADGQNLETGLDENKRLTVVVPAGTKGEVKLWYAGKRWWRISDAVSLLTALALIAARIQHRRKAQKA